MKTIKKIHVNSCLECPYCYQSPQDEIMWAYGDFSCDKCNGREINPIDYNDFPEWCPLQDVRICPMCFEEEMGINTDGLCEACFKANKEDDGE